MNGVSAKRLDELTISYIKESQVLILVVLVVNDEVDGQKAETLAKHVDPRGLRTIGVLTKPDTLSILKDFRIWLDVLQGEGMPRMQGYYVTRHPSQKYLHRSTGDEEARILETQFFENNSYWKLNSKLKERLGTSKLEEAITSLICDMVQRHLLYIEGDARTTLRQCQDDLILASPADPVATVLSMLHSFATSASKTILDTSQCGEPDHHDTQHVYQELKIAIRRTAPNFHTCLDANEFNKLPLWTYPMQGRFGQTCD
ncbi:hypothetical protein FRC03_004036 [Tulasnella sp. 419]|nr:hypothetical protein FRC03_004036 [Tulasnella sp. 419]